MTQHWLDVIVSRIAVAANRRGDRAQALRACRLLRRIRVRHPLRVT